MTADIFDEYSEVIHRARFRRTNDEAEAMLRSIREQSLWVKSAERIYACSDPDDDMFLECARAAAADYLVTGNLKHFPFSHWGSLRIVSAAAFLALAGV
jgi:uncharacterized protein